MKLNVIVAHDVNNVIGQSSSNQMPWHLPPDLKNFKKITMGKPIIMGHNTYKSLGRVLPGRQNIVILSLRHEIDFPRDEYENVENEPIIGFSSLTKALIYCESWLKVEETFIIGGGKIYADAIKNFKIDFIYRTLIEHAFEGDILFPKLDESNWEIISDESNKFENLNYRFQILKNLR